MANPQHIVIIGGGAGGLELATRLGARFGRERYLFLTFPLPRSRLRLVVSVSVRA